jgi:hypothetical protein
MKQLKFWLCAGSAVATLAFAGAAFAADDDQAAAAPAAAPAAPAPTPMANPAVAGPLVANPNPATFDAGPFGKITVDGVVSGLFMGQSAPAYDGFGQQNQRFYADVSNAQVIINKSDGPVQFYFQAGAYSTPVVGEPYYKASKLDPNLFGYVPQGFLKLVPNSAVSIEVGALPTLIGDEYTYTFQNYNIERGLLWNQEPAVSKGIQLNYTQGPWALSFAVTDGYYSGAYTALSGLATYTFKNSDTLAFAAEGNVGAPRIASFATPTQQNDGMIYNLIYTHSQGPLTISPYIQYGNSPSIRGVSYGGDEMGVALLTKWQFNPTWSLAGRIEYIGSKGQANLLGYGVDSNAVTLTLTPTFQKGIFFARGEFSFASVGNGTPGLLFGGLGRQSDQFRGLFETGLMF